MAIISVQK